MKQIAFTIVLLAITVLTTSGQDRYLETGNSYLNNGQVDKAEQNFREAVKSDTTNLIYQCQLALTLIQAKKYLEADELLDDVLQRDSNNVAAIWYSGIGNFYNAKDRQAIDRFEKVLPLLDKKSGQYYSANWFIGKCYSVSSPKN